VYRVECKAFGSRIPFISSTFLIQQIYTAPRSWLMDAPSHRLKHDFNCRLRYFNLKDEVTYRPACIKSRDVIVRHCHRASIRAHRCPPKKSRCLAISRLQYTANLYKFAQQYPLIRLTMKPTKTGEEKTRKQSFSGTAARDAGDDRAPAFLVPAAQLAHNKTSSAPPSRPFTPFIVGPPSHFTNTLHWAALGPYALMPLHVAEDTPLFAEREEWADVQPLEQYEGANPIAPIFYTAQCEFGSVQVSI
jgi:hypothetical protein